MLQGPTKKDVKGVITIKLLYAELQNMDRGNALKDMPFCICYFGRNRFQTEETFGRTERPIWKSSFILNHIDEDQIKIKVCSINLLSRNLEMLGEGIIHMDAIKIKNESLINRVILYKSGMVTGILMVETTYVSRGKGEIVLEGHQPKVNEILKKGGSLILDDISGRSDVVHDRTYAKSMRLDTLEKLDTSEPGSPGLVEDKEDEDEFDYIFHNQ